MTDNASEPAPVGAGSISLLAERYWRAEPCDRSEIDRQALAVTSVIKWRRAVDFAELEHYELWEEPLTARNDGKG